MLFIFWICLLAFAHTWIFFPILMKMLARGRQANGVLFEKNEAELPHLTILMAVFNEEKVIAEKLECLAAVNYPSEKLQILIGSDGSSDATNSLIFSFLATEMRPGIEFFPFEKRRGKPPVINELASLAFARKAASPAHVLVLTDASVMLQPATIFRLARHFKNPEIGVVDANMIGKGLRETGISRSENQYLSREVALKNDESRACGLMMGPFGGCFAVRADLFEPVPPNSLVDDFFITMRVLEKGFRAINELEAICHEGATHKISDEYRRKTRIAAGSFQNLARFRRLVLPPVSRLGFVFFSHKVLRWFGGFWLLGLWISAGWLAGSSRFFEVAFWVLTAGFGAGLLGDFLLNLLKINWLPARNLRYFLMMNIALVHGFFRWLGGIRTNIWQPTTRY